MPIDAETTVAHLRTVGCTVAVDGDTLTALPPTWRPDLTDPFDLVEEVARIVGYTEVPSVLPAAPAGRGLTAEQRLRRRVGLALAGAGLVEVKTYPFIGQSHLDDLGVPADDARRRTVRVANPLSEERPELTTTLLPALLETAARNVGRGTTSLGIFETAVVFLPHEPARQGADPRRRHPADRRRARRPGDRRPRAAPPPRRRAGRRARRVRLVGHGPPGHLGRRGPGRPRGRPGPQRPRRGRGGHPGTLAPRPLRRDPRRRHRGRSRRRAAPAGLHGVRRTCPHRGRRGGPRRADPGRPPDAGARLLDLPGGQGGRGTGRRRRPSPRPTSRRRCAEGAGELLESVRLFDVYTGEQIGAGKKSLAFALRFRAPDRTLTEAEISAARDAAVALAAERHGAVHRS